MKATVIVAVFLSSLLKPVEVNSIEADIRLPLLAYRMSEEARMFTLPQAQYTTEVRRIITLLCHLLAQKEGKHYYPLYIDPYHENDSFDLRWVQITDDFKFDRFLEGRASNLRFFVSQLQAQGLLEFEVEDLDDDWLWLHITPIEQN